MSLLPLVINLNHHCYIKWRHLTKRDLGWIWTWLSFQIEHTAVLRDDRERRAKANTRAMSDQVINQQNQQWSGRSILCFWRLNEEFGKKIHRQTTHWKCNALWRKRYGLRKQPSASSDQYVYMKNLREKKCSTDLFLWVSRESVSLSNEGLGFNLLFYLQPDVQRWANDIKIDKQIQTRPHQLAKRANTNQRGEQQQQTNIYFCDSLKHKRHSQQ